MKTFTKILIPIVLLASSTAFATPAQIAVAKKALYQGEIAPYATPELKRLLKQAHIIDARLAEKYNSASGSGCDFFELSYLTGGFDIDIKNVKASASNNIVRITFNGYANGVPETKHLLEFKMKGNQIDDVRSGHSENPRKTPVTDSSLKADAKKLVDTYDCY